MGYTQLVLSFVDRAAFEAAYREHLRLGRAYVRSETTLPTPSAVWLVLVHPETGSVLPVATETVDVVQHQGAFDIELRFDDRGPEAIARIGGFVAEMPNDDAPEDTPDDANEGETDAEARDEPLALSPRIERLRNLNEAQRMHVARGSVLEDRVVLERLYGNSVWPLLLHNPKISVAEVARMARKGTMPRPLLDFVAENEGWIRQSLIRRALLANPRLSPDSAMRVLRATPPKELKLVPQQTAYPMQVRTLAQRLVRGSTPK